MQSPLCAARRLFTSGALLAATLVLTAFPTAAQQPASTGAGQGYPARPIRIVVPSSAGGTQDTLARLLAPRLSESWGQAVVVENRGGAGGMIGASIVAKAAPDGYTLLLASPGFAVNAALRPDLPYDARRDFVGVAQIGFSTIVLVVAPQLGVKSVKELIAAAHAQPGKILFGSSGAGSSTHMNAERFRMAAGIKATHVGFKGQPEFLLAIATGRVHYGAGGLGPALPFIRDGKLVPLAVTTPQRAALLPEVPTSAEVLPGWGRDGSQGVLAPAKTPRAIVQQINREVGRILAMPEVRDRLQSIDFNIVTSTPEAFTQSLHADIALFTKVAKAAGLVAK
jgi:tripartite-type tricarboxylate transporter receptor subunit TctC